MNRCSSCASVRLLPLDLLPGTSRWRASAVPCFFCVFFADGCVCPSRWLFVPTPPAALRPVLQVAAIGSAMVKVGLGPHARVGVYGANSPEWMIAMQVCSMLPRWWFIGRLVLVVCCSSRGLWCRGGRAAGCGTPDVRKQAES